MRKEQVTDLKLKFFKLRGVEGKSFDTISDELGVSKPTLIKWERSLRSEMDEIRRSEIQNLISNYSYCLKARLEQLIKLSKRVETELMERDLFSTPTPKLVEMLLNLNSRIFEIESDNRLSDSTYEVGFDKHGYFTESLPPSETEGAVC
jgi:hypothetical protein